VLTITTAAFGATAGERVTIFFTSGSLDGVKQSYIVASGGNTFTITKTGSGAGGNCVIKRFQLHSLVLTNTSLGQGVASSYMDAPSISMWSSIWASRIRQSSMDITADNIRILSDDTAYKGWIKIGPNTNPAFINSDGSFKVGAGTYRAIAASAFNVNSDIRLKKNVETMNSTWEKVKSIRPVKYNWVGDDGHEDDMIDRDGFIAQELELLYPEVVTTPMLGPDETIAYKQVDMSKLIPSVTKALQEAMARIESLEEEIRQLKG